MKIYVHKKTIRYTDYGSPLETVRGIAWSTSGKRDDACGFERGKTLAEALEKARGLGFDASEGEDIERTCDMNPHGLM